MSAPDARPLAADRAEQACPTVLAANTAQVITDRPDDERDMVNRRGTEIGLGTLRDNLALHDRDRVADGQPATLSLALRLATGALLLTAAEVDDVKVGHAAQGTLRAPVKHPIFGRASVWLAAQNRPTDPPGLTGGTMSAPFSSGLTTPFDGEPGNPKQPLAAP
jgi:hypothetical protein